VRAGREEIVGSITVAGYAPPSRPWQTALPGLLDVSGVTVYPGNWSPGNWTTDAQSGVPSAATVTELSLSAGVTVA
jgi:hypothetical protein